MRSIAARQRMAKTAAAAVSLALLAACSPKNPAAGDPAGQTPGAVQPLAAGTLVISDGSNKVLVGDHAYTFPTTVTDGTLSADGSRIAFVDGDGNIATAHLDGKGMVVLTKPLTNGTRSRPAWRGTQIVFSEKVGNGTAKLRSVSGSGTPYPQFGYTPGVTMLGAEADADLGEPESGDNPTSEGYAPSSAVAAPGLRGNDLAFQRDGAGGSAVYISDINGRVPSYGKFADGSEPALSDNDGAIAFVKGGQIWVEDLSNPGGKPVQITFDAKSPTHLAFSPDGSKIVFSTPSDVETVASTVAPGATSNPATVVYPKPGVASYIGALQDRVIHIKGTDPVATAIAASQARWPSNPDGVQYNQNPFAEQILLVGLDNPNIWVSFAAAQMVDVGPLLVTSGATLDTRTAAEIKRLFGKPQPQDYSPATVTIVGGPEFVPSSVDSAIKKMGYKVRRVATKNPMDMAVSVNDRPNKASMVLVAEVGNISTYLAAISDLGAYSNQTVLLGAGGTIMPTSLRNYLTALPPKVPVYAVGQDAQEELSLWSKTRWQPMGDSPASSSAKLLSAFGGSTNTLVLTPADNNGDVLAAIGLARAYGAPILAVSSDGIDQAVLDWARTASGQIDTVIVVDTKGSISADVEKAVTAAVSGPLGPTTVTNPPPPQP